MRDVLVTENIVGSEMESLKGRFDVAFEPEIWSTPDRLQEMIVDFRAIVVRNQTRVTSELIASAPHLQVIGRAGAGLDNIDLDAASSAGIVVAYTPRDSTGIELYGKTLGLVGLGRIGYRVGARAKAFGMDVVACDLYANPDAITVSELFARMMDLDELLGLADFVSCHVPLTSETVGLFNYEKFCKMKSTAYLINTSRGEVVDEEALAQALKEKRIAGAGLDVRQEEPPPKGPLSEMDNVILTPHIGAFTREGQERVVSSVCRDVAAILAGGEAKNYFNLPKPKRM
jgi:phosphoglycerate dehydrogenase-like enzyme